MNVVKVEAYKLSDVKENVNRDLDINATIAWKKAGSPTGAAEFESFAQDFLSKHKKANTAYVVVEAPVADTRENPYKIDSIPTNGARKTKRIYEIINAETNQILGQGEYKNEAMDIAREIVRKKREELGIGIKHYCRIVDVVVEGEPKAFTFEYVPSAKTKLGNYIVFYN